MLSTLQNEDSKTIVIDTPSTESRNKGGPMNREGRGGLGTVLFHYKHFATV